MHVAIPPAHRTERGAEIRAHRVEHRFAESQAAGAVADERGKNISLAQGQPQRDAEGFLAASEKDSALNFASPVKAGHFIVQHP